MIEYVEIDKEKKKKRINKYTTIRRGDYYNIHYVILNLNNIVMILIGMFIMYWWIK